MKYVVGLLAIISIVACKQTRQKEEPKSYFCSPQLEAFFSGADSLPVIEFKHSDTVTTFLEKLYYVIDTPCYFATFKIPFVINSSTAPIYLKSSIIIAFPTQAVSCGRRNNIIDIAVNKHGQYLVEGELGDTSLIRKMLMKLLVDNSTDPYYLELGKKTFASIEWDYETPKVHFDAAIKAILIAYTDAMNTLSIKNFNKEFCHLEPNEADEILQLIQFNLELKYREIEYPEIDFILPLPKGSFKDLP